MRVLAHVPNFLPRHNSGGEVYLFQVLKSLEGSPAEVVLIEDDAQPRQMGNIQVVGVKTRQDEDYWYRWADIVITHLGKTGRALNKTRKHKKPLVHLIHNDFRMKQLDLVGNQFFIYNSHWVKSRLNYRHPGIVWYPQVRKFKNSKLTAKYITLVNCNENKGGDIFIEIAKKMPEEQFLGVRGAYKFQIEEKLPNLTYVDNINDMSWVYENTKILLCPSYYESFGIAAREAAVAGIPVIAHPTGGLVENLGNYALWCDRRNIQGYVNIIKNIANFKGQTEQLCITKNENIYGFFQSCNTTSTFIQAAKRSQEVA